MNGMMAPPASLPPGAKVFAYIRDSGGMEQELSVARQIEEIQRWADHYGIIVTKYFSDEARSGRTMHKREHLASMLEQFRSGGLQERGVVVWSYDRFARNAVHSQFARAEIRSLGYVFHSLTDYIPEGKESILFEAFKDYASEQFSEKLSINVKSGVRGIFEKYKALGGYPPRGFIREPIEIGVHRNGKPRIVHKWIPDPDLIPTVRLAFEMRARRATLKQIMDATQLYKDINSYTTFFANRLYIGIMEFGELIDEQYCEPIITTELFEQVQQVQREVARATTENSPRRLGSNFILSGLIFCQHCGSPLNGHVIAKAGKKRREYYTCQRKARKRDCPSREIPRAALEEHIIKKLEDIALDLERLIQFQTRVQYHYNRTHDQLEGERLRLRRKLSEANKQIANFTQAIGQRGPTKTLLTALDNAEQAAREINKDIEEIESKLIPPQEYTPQQLRAIAEEIKQALHGDEVHQKKHAIHMLTSRIVAIRRDAHIEGVLYYIPNVCVQGSTPTGDETEGIQILIPIPKYTKSKTPVSY